MQAHVADLVEKQRKAKAELDEIVSRQKAMFERVAANKTLSAQAKRTHFAAIKEMTLKMQQRKDALLASCTSPPLPGSLSLPLVAPRSFFRPCLHNRRAVPPRSSHIVVVRCSKGNRAAEV
jgi:hypothetical protein